MKRKIRAALPLLALSVTSVSWAQDPSIDRLLSKLPPPEKIEKPAVRQEVQQADPAANDPLVAEIIRASDTGNNAQALNASRKLVQRHPQSAGAQCLLGFAALELRQFNESSTAFRLATTLGPKWGIAHYGFALLEATQGHFAAAIPHLKRLAEVEPGATVAYYALSYCMLRAGRKEESVGYAKKAAALQPSNVYMWLQLARAEKSLGHTDATLNAITKAASVAPDSGTMLSLVGFAYINLNRIPEAISPLERAARFLPRDYLVQAQLGYCLQAVGRVDASIGYLRKATSLNPKYGPAWEHLGLAFQKKGNHAEAAKAFERAAQLMPQSPNPRRHLAEEHRLLDHAQDTGASAPQPQRKKP